MKKYLTTIFSVCLLLAALILPASALEYTFDSPSTGDFGTPTSDETIYEHENPNVDRSKNSALIPPGFGTPTSYLPNSGVYLTPNLAANGPLNSPSLTGTITGGGEMAAFPGAVDAPLSSYPTFNYPTTSTTAADYTDVTSDLYYSNGSLGTLDIPSIGLSVKVYEGTDSDALKQGVGHFENTSIWAGNVALGGHNRGVNTYFGQIHTLKQGATITLTTKLGTRTYAVTSVEKVSETDTSGLAATASNQITLYTCVRDQSAYRWRVTAQEV